MRINAIAPWTLAMAGALLVAGCDKECGPASQAANSPDQFADVRKAAEDNVRGSANNPDSVRFRGAHVWTQAAKNRFAVCGQATVFGPNSNTYVLFVAIVTRGDVGQEPASKFQVDARVGSTVTDATRVYIDTLARCYEGGGPQDVRRDTAPSVPPIPDDVKAVLANQAPAVPATPVVPAPVAQPQPSAMAQPVPASSPASGTVVMRQNGNIRIAPRGETVRVEPQGKELRVFGEAPGGWLQIGDTAVNGWVHGSLVQRR